MFCLFSATPTIFLRVSKKSAVLKVTIIYILVVVVIIHDTFSNLLYVRWFLLFASLEPKLCLPLAASGKTVQKNKRSTNTQVINSSLECKDTSCLKNGEGFYSLDQQQRM